MKILVLSCDNYVDTFVPFHHCLEKYWPDHPEVIYKTETIDNPYYKTMRANYPLHQWTKGVREVLEQIDDEHIMLMMDDIFIRKPVDTKRIEQADRCLKGNIALMNFEKSFDGWDEPTEISGWKKRRHNSQWEVSIMCGLWDRKKLMRVLDLDSSPWDVEYMQRNAGYDYYINSGDYIIDWNYRQGRPSGISRGKWQRECIQFFEDEGIEVDYSKRGING